MKLSNVYEIEQLIKNKLLNDNLFVESLVFVNQNENDADNRMFSGLQDDESNAVLISYEGFTPVKHNNAGRGSTLAQKLVLRYRIIVVSPDNLYYTNAGKKFTQVVNSIKSLDVDGCNRHQLVEDTHEFHMPSYTNNMVSVPQVWEFEVII